MSSGTLARYLSLVAFVALLAAPGWTTPVVLAVAVAVTVLRLARSAARALPRRQAAPCDAVALGSDSRGRAVTISVGEFGAHGLILGASGSGKTTALSTILEQQIRRGQPVVAIDMKGSPGFAMGIARAAEAAGRPFKLWTPDGPSRWNPLAQGNAIELKDKLIGTERFTEPHYQRAAERYLQTVLQVLQHADPERPPTLAEVVALMDPRRLPARLAAVPRPLVERVQDYLAGLTPDQLSAIRGLQTRLAIITESETARYLAPDAGGVRSPPPDGSPTIDLAAALAGRDVVLFSLNSSRYGQFAAQLGTLAVQDLIAATGSRLEQLRQGRSLPQATIAIDEFSGIGGAHVVALFARGREAGVAGLVATQEIADLDRLGRGVRDQILGNTAIKLVLRQEVPESADLVAQIAGTERVWEETRQIGGSIFRGFPAGGTRRETEQFIIHPNEIKSLRTGDAVLISKLAGGRARTIRVEPPAPFGPGPVSARRPLSARRPGSSRRPGSARQPGSARRPDPARGQDSARRGGYPDPGVIR